MAREAGKGAIEIRVEKIEQLFNSLDPFPFREKDLDREAEEFIVGWARELPKQDAIEIVIHVPAEEARTAHDDLAGALRRYFDYRAEIVGLELRELFRVGRRSLAIGLAVLAACLVAQRAIANVYGTGEVTRFIGEGLIILGWVANWKPIEIFLYDWWPVANRRNLYRRLSRASVRLKAHAPRA
ncbi:MAG: hypothetical protein ACM30I_16625 [Gemmatimonas sp.]